MLEDERWCFRLRVSYHIQQSNDVRLAAQMFQDLDDALAVVRDVHALEDFRVLAPADLPHHLVVLLLAPARRQALVVPVLAGPPRVGVGVDAGAAQAVLHGWLSLGGCRLGGARRAAGA